MKILVLAKQVPDTWQERELSLETGWVVRDGAAEPVPDEISERVMEVALGWRDAGADIEVVALTVGPEDSSKTLRKMLAMGADSAVQITDDALVGSDAVQTARVIAAAVEKEGADLVLAGTLSTDGGTGVVPAMVAELLERPYLPHAEAPELADGELTGTVATSDADVRAAVALPAVAGLTEKTAEPRFPNFKNIMAAKKKPLTVLSLADLGIAAGPAEAAYRSVMVSADTRPERAAGEKVTDDGTAAERLVEFLAGRGLV
ncbi:electron transfer flavoprotein subunit beta/FixA family protein [Micrococcus luteus]|uniref:Electron transfer flavoprotein subunit beta n=3 Tax=Actinomycetes TaxID=1760 RepID=A0AAQ1MH36_MICLU|nr:MULTISPECIES: electron transfer flavoprotein subunit beta/FixA family protein [Micrococcus]CVM94286.1 Electron transfer flavoprotein small subunit [Streptococcus pneumoniae]AWD24853.1 electron transfer flavoprotein subunit beta/FixA family protein [Micrococcus luteus]AYO50868.1 electron transfer flavoprotein subunit beta/FixA family protein [Micrococcus luteus]KZE70407.1 electron transfer flavoprotein subunit beta [Micrococcus aloeverae]MBA9081321.1 electron transfer flavoprotein beta subun